MSFFEFFWSDVRDNWDQWLLLAAMILVSGGLLALGLWMAVN